MGFPAEDDSNFCAYLACMANDSVEFRYSGAYSAFIYCYNALYAENRDRAAEVWAQASEQVKADCRAANSHYDQYLSLIHISPTDRPPWEPTTFTFSRG